MILVSPTEPPILRVLGRSSPIPESRGADYLIPAASMTLFAVQRKTIDDLINSLADGRLERELLLLRRGPSAVVIEGDPQWTTDGWMIHRRRFTKRQYWGMLFTLTIDAAIPVLRTTSVTETADLLRALESWLQKPAHLSLLRRPTAAAVSEWGTPTDRDFARHLLQGFPGIGVTLADAIFDWFGRVPLSWTVSLADLESVPGIGRKRALALWRSLTSLTKEEGEEGDAQVRRSQTRRRRTGTSGETP